MKQSLKLMTAKYGCCWLHLNSWGKNQTGNQDVTSHWCPQVLIYLEKVKTSFVQSVKKKCVEFLYWITYGQHCGYNKEWDLVLELAYQIEMAEYLCINK